MVFSVAASSWLLMHGGCGCATPVRNTSCHHCVYRFQLDAIIVSIWAQAFGYPPHIICDVVLIGLPQPTSDVRVQTFTLLYRLNAIKTVNIERTSVTKRSASHPWSGPARSTNVRASGWSCARCHHACICTRLRNSLIACVACRNLVKVPATVCHNKIGFSPSPAPHPIVCRPIMPHFCHLPIHR